MSNQQKLYIEVESEEQFYQLIQSNEQVVVEFYATWCGPCRELAKSFESINEQYPDLKILKIDVDESELEGLIESHQVCSLPTVFHYMKGEQISSFVGNNPKKLFEMAKKSFPITKVPSMWG